MAIHRLEMEEYLLGVLPSEMDPSWPLEALKAQAVIARTFAFAHMGRYHRDGFDLTSDTRSQSYKKPVTNSDSVRRAVEETRGEVLGFKGELLTVYYHSSCGGHTASPAAVWGSGSPLRPLKGVSDPYCEGSPYKVWTAYFRDEDILGALSDSRKILSGPLQSVKVSKRDLSGIVSSFLITAGSEGFKIGADQLRRLLGATELRSSRISGIRRLERGFEFTGSGSGHGVGLCQWGARLQAQRGKSYERILKFYFPGSVLSVVE